MTNGNAYLAHSRMSYSGSILNPQAAPSTPAAPPAHRAPQPAMFTPAQAPAPVPQPSPAVAPTQTKAMSSPLSPPIKQGGPQPWVPNDVSKTKDLQCGDKTAHRGTSTYYDEAPLDPSKVPVCNNCHINIRLVFFIHLKII